jgi:hypothetical protein
MEAEASFQQASVQSSFTDDTNVQYCDTPEISTAKHELDTYCRADQQKLALQMQRASEWAGFPMGGKGPPASRQSVEDMVAQIMQQKHGHKRIQPPSDNNKNKSNKKGKKGAPTNSAPSDLRHTIDFAKWRTKYGDVNGTKVCFFHLHRPEGCTTKNGACKNSHSVFPGDYQGKKWAQLTTGQQETILKDTKKA